jgi:hypothetical protein
LVVTVTGTCADELTALKAQIEDLSAKVSRIEAEPALPPPSSSGLLSIRDGQGVYATAPEPMRDHIKPDSGITILAFPTADGAPSGEISISGETRVLLSTKSHQ